MRASCFAPRGCRQPKNLNHEPFVLREALCVRPSRSPAAVPPRGAMNILETHSLKTDSRIGLAKMEGLLNSVLGASLHPNPIHCTVC